MEFKEFVEKIQANEKTDLHLFWEAISEYNADSPKAMISVQEAMTSKDALLLMPKIIYGTLQEAAEPLMIGSKLLATIQLNNGNVLEFPSVSALRAFDIPEGGEYPKQNLDFQLHKTMSIKVSKKGLQFDVTEEAVRDSQWDVIGLHVKAAGRAMQRLKEQKIWTEFEKHGHTRFDGHLAEGSVCAPTGVGAPDKAGHSTYNHTMSTLDWIDLIMTLIGFEMAPTDIIINPLMWPGFVKTMFFGGLGIAPKGYTQPNAIPLGPEALSAVQPFGINLIMSPFVPLDKGQRTGSVYVIDRGEVGVLVVRDGMSADEWANPARDIQSMKVKERYGIGIRNEGRAIVVAKNLNIAESYGFGNVQLVHEI